MILFYRSMIILILAIGMSHSAMSDTQPPIVQGYPSAKLGSEFSFVDGAFLLKCQRWKVTEINAEGLIVSKCGDNTMYVTAENGNPVMTLNGKHEIVAKFTPFYPDTAFPLFVGKKWSGKYHGQEGTFRKWSGDLSCEVTTYESVQVVAGKFDAFRIECIDKWDAGIIFMHGTKKSTRWYAPSINLTIKSVNEDSKWDYELASFNER
ncbi:hypothetical protein AAKU67_003143 [Oxalobacteraceae bacterium GrIS 2.11]